MDKEYLRAHFDDLAATNYAEIPGEIRGIILRFHGLGHKVNLATDMICGPLCAKHGVLYLYPFYNPWSWMNKKTVDFIDALLDIVIETYHLKKDIPIGIFGSSMGGYSALTYPLHSKYKFSCIDLNCPCCNMEYELFEHKQTSLTRSYFESAMADCEDFSAYIRKNSPLNRIADLPKIPYRFAIGLQDQTLLPEKHGLLMASKMEAVGFNITVMRYSEVGHCNLGADGFAAEHTWLCEKIKEKSNG